jgi:CheY-like chemotaxis protein
MGVVAAGTREGVGRLVTRHSLRGAHARVLLAEDNSINQKVATKMLENLGYSVDVVGDGLEALEALSRNSYDLILMDVQMPQMDGYVATQRIREREEEEGGAGRLPIIAMTAGALEGDRERALEAGMDDYISKPVTLEALDEILGRWSHRERRGTVAAGEPEAGATEELLDRAVVENLRQLGGPELVSELVRMFLEDAESRLAALREGVEKNDAGALERTAHTLKGSSGNMGATRMAAVCAELEEAGASRDLGRAPGLLTRLEEEFGRVRPALEAEASSG